MVEAVIDLSKTHITLESLTSDRSLKNATRNTDRINLTTQGVILWISAQQLFLVNINNRLIFTL